ncbi:hypothetical protein TL16_g10264 [Triparma laevis f. inornata]|uniref:Uncharacterized protein n=1 Tax=Triparma laevis f. inornata TaxID=1714386 RepID=A0A9W7BBI5_9STRA|nr:hypothetical protein TL16_g10264 [Triparma laevis f. inornata]
MYQLMMQQQQASMMQATFDNNQYIPGAMTGVMTGQLAVYPKTDVKPESVSLGYNQSQSLGGGLEKMPCRARGVPADHTFQTAYFIVKKGTPHGTLLKCSHPYCSEAGWKFRFCMFCKLPVAKRNFTKRHSHLPNQGDKKPPEPTSEEGQRILEELEQPIRLSQRERGFLDLLESRPVKGAVDYDSKIKDWCVMCVENSKPEPPPKPKIIAPVVNKPRINTRGSSQQQAMIQDGVVLPVPAMAQAPMGSIPQPMAVQSAVAPGVQVSVRVNGNSMNGATTAAIPKPNGSEGEHQFHTEPVPAPAAAGVVVGEGVVVDVGGGMPLVSNDINGVPILCEPVGGGNGVSVGAVEVGGGGGGGEPAVKKLKTEDTREANPA